MGSDMVVIASPVLDDNPRFSQRVEPVLPQALVPELADEGFDIRILGGLAGLNEVELDGVRVRPFQHRF